MTCIIDWAAPTGELTPLETAIMDRWDAGESIEQIARAGFNLGMTKVTVYRYGAPLAEERDFANAAAAACAAHAAAIAATGRCYA
ncbi:hypothetical protein [Sphingomonas sp.]|uniref:hypothetical protein n=1 Tax=Sphingomonas sp. TaxID=28214 RepID=UPI003CC6CE79